MLYLIYKGMNLFEVGLLEGIYHLTSFLMETPTGVVADIFGRKKSRLIGLIFIILSSIFMVVSTNFWGCAFAFILTALSNNFESGAAEAMVYDSLVLMDKEKSYMKITGKLEVVFQLASVVGLVIGGVIGTFSYARIYVVVIGITLILICIGWFFHEPIIEKESRKQGSIRTMLGAQYIDSYQVLKGNKKLIYIIVFGSIISTFLTLSFFYLQVAWKTSGFMEWNIGLFLAVSSVCGAFGGLIAEKVDRRFGDVVIMKYSPYLVAVLIPSFYFVRISIVSFSILCILESIIFVATRDYINKLIPSKMRATIMSFDSAVFSLCMISLFPVFGFVSDHIGINQTFLLLGSIFLILSLINSRVVETT